MLTPDAGATPGCSVEYFVGMLSGERRESVILPPSTCVLECSECRERARRESADKTLERALEFLVSTVPVDAPVFLPASWNEPRQGSEFTKQRNYDLHLVTL